MVLLRSSILLQLLYKAAPPLVLLDIKSFPLAVDLIVQFQLGTRLGMSDAVFNATLHNMVQDDGIDAFILKFRPDSDQQQVNKGTLF